jgi:hypothetical protein
MERLQNLKEFVSYFQKYQKQPNLAWTEKDFTYIKNNNSF